MKCPKPVKIVRLFFKDLSPREKKMVEDHLTTCPKCQDTHDTLKQWWHIVQQKKHPENQ
jgi:hypothetical protein